MDVSTHVQASLDSIPTKTGCYLMLDEDMEVIYVGKAVNLRNRVRSYFHASAQENPRTRQLVKRVVDIEWIVVGSELEALILEMNLIKEHQPRYNVRLKDDKRYPYIKLHWADPFPKVTVTRRVVDDGAKYFGPYTSVWAVHQTLDVLRRIFPYLTCNRTITGKDQRACLYYDIKLCAAPCIGAVDQTEYRKIISNLEQFLNGRTEEILNQLKSEMQKAANELKFEQAATIRDQLEAIHKVVERQKVVLSSDYTDTDVIAMARSEREACVQVFFIRAGKLIGREYFLMEGTDDTPDATVVAEFIKQFYDQNPTVPPQVLLPHEVEEAKIIRKWLNSRRGGQKVQISIPRRGQKQELVKMATENASETLEALQNQWETDEQRQTEALAELQENLNLPKAPKRIECYDISNIGGTAIVGSMVVFEQGVPDNRQYRRFNIRSVEGPDDFASLEEMLTRRFRRLRSSQNIEGQQPGENADPSFSSLPDLVIIDGGKGQLNRALEVLDEFDLRDVIPIVGLAKKKEKLFMPEHSQPIQLPRKSEGLYLVQRIRDEAHASRSRHIEKGDRIWVSLPNLTPFPGWALFDVELYSSILVRWMKSATPRSKI